MAAQDCEIKSNPGEIKRGAGFPRGVRVPKRKEGRFLPQQLAVGLEKALRDINARLEKTGLDDPRQARNPIVLKDFFSPK